MSSGIDGLTLGDELGRGGFGAVYLAQDESHGRQVAVKILTGRLDDSARRRFDRERRAMGTLSGHPNIGVVHTSGFTAAGEAYIVMEYLSGGSLEDRLAAGPLPATEVVEIGLALAEALDLAHRSGVTHLDVKPANVLYSAFGRPKLVDFGIAALAGDERATSTISGTPAYAAPEIFDGQEPTPAADVYGLAATMYALLMGGPPYTATVDASAMQVLREVAVSPVPAVDRADVVPGLRQLLYDAMAKDPAGRPPSMQAFRERLAAVQAAPSPTAAAPPAASTAPAVPSSLAPPAPPRSQQPQRSQAPLVALAVVGLLVVVGVVVFAMTRSDDDPDPRITTDRPTAEPDDRPTAEPDDRPTPTERPRATPTQAADLALVPEVAGLDEFQASSLLTNAGFVPVVATHCFAFASGSLPAGGTRLAEGAVVEVVFDPCVVPDFVGLTLDQSIALVDILVALRIEWPDHCQPIVLGQSIAPGTVVEPNTTVFLELPPPPC